MTPALSDLPLRLGDAITLAGLIFEFAEGRALNDDVRARIAGRAAALRFESMVAYVGSLERDPIHPSAYYCCADGIGAQPFLLRVAPAATPSSGLFPHSILIGRPYVGGREAVINVVPFGPEEHGRIGTFAESLNPAFLPQPFGTKPVIRIHGDAPALQFPIVIERLRSLLKTTGQSGACFLARAGAEFPPFYFATVWAMIRAGWRDGYVLQADINTKDDVRKAVLYTRFGLRSGSLIEAIREQKRASFDIELIAEQGALEASLEDLRKKGYSAQSVRVGGELSLPKDAEAIASRFRAQLNQRDISLGPLTNRQGILDALPTI